MARRTEVVLISAKKSRGFIMQIYSRIPANFGGEEPKFEISGRIKLPETGVLKNLPIPMVEKRFASQSLKNKYIRIWQRFWSVGLPVIPSMYHSGKSVFMPDLRAYGWELYGKSKWNDLTNNRLQSSEKHDPLFLSIMRNQWQHIAKQARGYSQIATENKVGLPWDGEAFILGVHESGKYKLLTLDLIAALEFPFGNHEEMSEHNSSRTNIFMEMCIRIEQCLRPRYQNTPV